MRMRQLNTLALMAVCGVAAAVNAQTSAPSTPATPTEAAKPEAKADESSRTVKSGATAVSTAPAGAVTLGKMMRVVSADFTENTVEQCMNFIRDVSGADFEILWSESGGPGLDREKTLTLSAKNMTVLALLEKVLGKATGDIGAEAATWQMTDGGAIQVGLKSSLNKFSRLEIYDITDLLFQVRDKTNVPELDLQASFQAAGQGGGGGGQSPFGGSGGQQNSQQNNNPQRREEMGREVKNLIAALVETEQWTDNGGDGGSITYWQGTLLIKAPDYMHRQINGYPYWDSDKTAAGKANGRRYVSLDADVQRSNYDRIRNVPVTGASGGGR